MSIRYVTGDATRPHGEGPKVIAHICNDEGRWGSGFVVALSKRHPDPEEAYRHWALTGVHQDIESGQQRPFALGNTQFALFSGPGEKTWVANMIAQRGIRRSPDDPRAVQYGALEHCLKQVARFCAPDLDNTPNASVHMPRIGCGLGGGEWEEIEPLINDTLIRAGLDVTVYDF